MSSETPSRDNPAAGVSGRHATPGSEGGRGGGAIEDFSAQGLAGGSTPGRRRGLRRGGGNAERKMVPDADFTSYYGRPVVKASPWEADIPAYLFFGGVAGGSSVLAAGADLTGRLALRGACRLTATGAIAVSLGLLVHDLGRPARFMNMLRVAKPTSPMSVGTWILSVYAPMVGLCGAAEVSSLLPRRLGWIGSLISPLSRPAGLAAAVLGPAVASYTAVLLADTATPSWHEAYRELPFVFVGSASAASGGMGMLSTPLSQSAPARRLAIGGAALELVMQHRMEKTMGITAEPLHAGTAGRLVRLSKTFTIFGAVLAGVLGHRSRFAAAVAGIALAAGSACTRFGIFEAGQASARDPKYTVVPQRQRLNDGKPIRAE